MPPRFTPLASSPVGPRARSNQGFRDGCAGPLHVLDLNVTVAGEDSGGAGGAGGAGGVGAGGAGGVGAGGSMGGARAEVEAEAGSEPGSELGTEQGIEDGAGDDADGDGADGDDADGNDAGIADFDGYTAPAPVVDFVLGGFPKTGTSTLWSTSSLHLTHLA